MKRKMEICSGCQQFIEWKTYCPGSMSCGCIYSEMIFPSRMTKGKFLGKDVPENCTMMAEYCIKEWNDGKTTGNMPEV